jgi:hypothetical protein
MSDLGLKNEEQELVRLVGKFARDFAELPQLHPADMSEVELVNLVRLTPNQVQS